MRVYFHPLNYTFRCIDAATGLDVWEVDITHPDTGNSLRSNAVALGTGYIYIASLSSLLFRLDYDGTNLTHITTTPFQTVALAVDKQGFIYAGMENGRVAKYAPDGTEQWTYLVGVNYPVSSVAVAKNGNVIIGVQTRSGTISEASVICLSPDGHVVWDDTDTHTEGLFVACDPDGYVAAVSRRDMCLYSPDGILQWSASRNSVVYGIALTETAIYVAQVGNATQYNREDGAIVRRYRDFTPSGIDVDPDGYVYVAEGSRLYRYRPDGTLDWTHLAPNTIRGGTLAVWPGKYGAGYWDSAECSLAEIGAIIPTEPTTVRWTINVDATQTHYEVEYQESGQFAWTRISVASGDTEHTFPAGTFEPGKEYLVRVRVKVEDYDYTDWSEPASLNTIYPIICNPQPTGQVKLGIHDVGARILSPQSLDCQLKIEIADNPDYGNPIVYQLLYMPSGSTHGVDHMFTTAGNWYIRMTAEDSEGNITISEYIINLVQVLMFLEEPSVTLQGPQATHVTVRVSGTAIEHTASVTPEPPPESRIERLVEIESGDATICQTVAEELVSRWGREQKSVSGPIDLTVTLSYERKIRVIVPGAGIDEEMVLQKKEHRVVPESMTVVTMGDIVLDDNELIARILEKR